VPRSTLTGVTTTLVTGGTGVLGRLVVQRLVPQGGPVRVASRHPEPVAGAIPYEMDLLDGRGVAAAVDGVDTVVHCASTQSGGDEVSASNLAEAAHHAGVRHLLYISIVGIDRIPLRYYKAKLEAERRIERSGLGWTTLRTTQFHDLCYQLLGRLARLPVMVLPSRLRMQPVDAGEVADRLVELAGGAPAGHVADMGGPAVRPIADLARAYLRHTGRRRPIVPVWFPGPAFKAMRQGFNVVPDHADGRITFEEYLNRKRGTVQS
jgi:uncharacterized protein YbjT (DUF2867 family)